MRIAIDARELVGPRTGVGRYLSEILAAWDQIPAAAAHEYIICAPSAPQLPTLSSLQVSVVTRPGSGTRWEQLVLPRLLRRARADVLFAPGYSAPLLSRVPVVVTLHDVSFAAHPEWFALREGLRRRVLSRASARRAARVITVSDFSKREIVRHLGIPAERVEVIYSGVTSIPASPEGRPGSRDPRRVLLYVGSIFNRRHVPVLIAAFGQLARTHPELMLELVGDNRTTPRIDIGALILSSGAAARIRLRSYVPDEELAQLYARADAFAFLSEYEGFGLTPLEAIAAGVPVVVLDTEVAREIYGPAAVYVRAPDPTLVAQALEQVLFDPIESERLRAAATPLLQRYSWAECALRTLQVLLSR